MDLAYGFLLIIHVIVSLFLIVVILLQGGRGGLGEALGGAAAQSLFGGGVSTVITKITAVGAAIFLVTCLSLAKLSTLRGRSVIDRIPAELTGAIAPVIDPSAAPGAAPETSAPVSVVPSVPSESPSGVSEVPLSSTETESSE